MDGLSRVAGIGPTVRLGGETLTVRGRTLRHYAELEAEILRLRGDPFEMIRGNRGAFSRFGKMESTPHKKELLEELFNQIDMKWRIARIEEIHKWLTTLRGRIFADWQATRHNGEKHTFDWTAKELFRSPAEWEQVEKAVNQASGLDELAALDWINRTTEKKDERDSEWMLLFKNLAKEPYNMHPQQVLDLTLNQIWMLTSEDDEILANPIFHRDEQIQYFAQRKEKIAQAAKNLMEGKHWHA